MWFGSGKAYAIARPTTKSGLLCDFTASADSLKEAAHAVQAKIREAGHSLEEYRIALATGSDGYDRIPDDWTPLAPAAQQQALLKSPTFEWLYRVDDSPDLNDCEVVVDGVKYGVVVQSHGIDTVLLVCKAASPLSSDD